MVVVRLEARAPLRPLSLAGASPLLQKGIGRKQKVRRKLFGSTKDPHRNLRIASALIESSAAAFASRWSFDPVAEVPLPFGSISWTPLAREVTSLDPFQEDPPKVSKSNVSKDETIPRISTTTSPTDVAPEAPPPPPAPVPTCLNRNTLTNHSNVACSEKVDDENHGSTSGREKTVPTAARHSPTPPFRDFSSKVSLKSNVYQDPGKHLRQTKITDYGRIAKRKHKKELKL